MGGSGARNIAVVVVILLSGPIEAKLVRVDTVAVVEATIDDGALSVKGGSLIIKLRNTFTKT